MSEGSNSLLDQDPLAFLSGGGEMGRLIRSMDWSETPLGPAQSWPQSLRTAVSLCLASNFPINVIWGPQRVQIYNDGYWPICGVKHPHSMGQDYKECWFSAWPAIGASFERASAGETAFLENQRMFLDRNGYLEETFFTFSHSPIRDESGGVGGLFHPVTEMTQKTLAERRLQLLRDLADGTADAKTVEDVCVLVAQTLATRQLDLPFVLVYLVNGAGTEARLVGSAGLAPGMEASPELVDLAAGEQPGGWPFAEAVRSGSERQVDDLESRFQGFVCGPYPEPPKSAFVQPIHVPGLEQPLAILVASVSPRRPLDEPYRTFYAMLRESVTNALVAARAYEEERKKSKALAELDRAKTLFFTNISHEFRTPLTLLLGPVEDMLAKPEGGVLPENRETLRIVHYHSLRLLKLVNTLLDFSRIEAGRMQAVFQRTDIAALTSELASMFRSAIEKAGMRLLVECPAIDAPVYLDREMWEKIVLNLLSNAFKFTFAGEIEVRLRLLGEPGVSTSADRHVELTVRDTGVGIPAKDLPHVFERFHRAEGAKRRSHEGTGIGLALVYELVKLHGGGVRVESVEGRGTTFTVSIPTGSAHLPPDRMDAARAQSSTSLAPNLYVEEAQRWLPSEKDEGGRLKEEPINGLSLSPSSFRLHPSEQRPRIVLADDNADMREYVRRLLSPCYDVEAAPDGAAALACARRQPPDLVLADVMMPQLDGFALLRELRADSKTRTIPVILLSARAGEEARVEGLGQGADDYLIKPFSARELLARVDSHLALARLRREAEERIGTIVESITDGFIALDRDWRFVYANTEAERLNGMSRHQMLGRSHWEVFPATLGTKIEQEFRRAVTDQVRVDFENFYEPWQRWFAIRGYPIKDGGLSVYFQDITERKRAEAALKEADRRKDEFLATLAHELRNPLAPIRNAVQIMRLAGGNSEVIEQARQTIERQLTQLVRLVDDLLDVSRITRNKIDLRKERVALSSIIQSAVEISRPLIEGSRHELTVALSPQTVWLNADLTRMAQVVANLLNNAAKYTPERGRIWLSAELTSRERERPEAVIRVRDNGVGIPPAMLPHIFEMFAQVETSRDRAQGGLGIGLTLVKSLVDMHGGSVQATSAGPDQGSEFIVRLPVSAQDQITRVDGRAHQEEPGKKLPARRILVVDDNRDSAESLGLLLQMMGNEVRIAHDGRAALQEAGAFGPDLVLLDIGMPGMSGYEVAQHLRERPELQGMILVALTGWGQEEDHRRSYEAGFHHHLTKPADLAALEKLLTSLPASMRG